MKVCWVKRELGGFGYWFGEWGPGEQVGGSLEDLDEVVCG